MAALQHPTTVRNSIADFVVDKIDAGTGAGTIIFYEEAYNASPTTVLATLTFSDPAFDAATAGAAAAGGSGFEITPDTNTASGTVRSFIVKDSNAVEVFRGDVTSDDVGGGSIELSSVALGTGDTLSLSSLTYTAPA